MIEFPLDQEVAFILGRPCFITGPMAHRLRDLGHPIEPRLENEQGYVLHWMLHLYFQHGPAWREEAKRILWPAPEAKPNPPT